MSHNKFSNDTSIFLSLWYCSR